MILRMWKWWNGGVEEGGDLSGCREDVNGDGRGMRKWRSRKAMMEADVERK